MGKRKYYLFLLLIFIISLYIKCNYFENKDKPERQKKLSFKPNPILLKVLNGSRLPKPLFALDNPGADFPVDYSQYGSFLNLGKENYQYIIKDREGLKQAIGAGIYPNQNAILKDKTYHHYEDYGLLNQFHWESLTFNDWQKAFYIWTQAPEDNGIKSFFTAFCLEKAGLIQQAIKAYYATVVHFPRSACWTKDQTFVWYVGQVALENIHRLCREYPGLNLSLVNDSFKITNGDDTNLTNDIIEVNPGRLIQSPLKNKIAQLPNLNNLKVLSIRGIGKVQLIKYENGHWLMSVEGQPFYIMGMTYNPTKIGFGPRSDPHFMARWMFSDLNKNNQIDAPYDSWIDANKNGRKEETEPIVGDFQLMKDIGVNAIRLYPENDPITEYSPKLINKKLLRDMHKNYGIEVIIGDYLGAYTIGSKASWEEGTDYRDKQQKEFMKKIVREKVLDLKDEPFVLMWLLGNENNMPLDYTGHNATRTNAAQYPEAYAKFVNEVAEMIHEIDPDHPVAIGNVELDLLDVYQKYAPAIDIIGINSYRGSMGFGDLWKKAQEKFDRPVLITEFGCDAYAQAMGEDQAAQLNYHKGKWEDIILNEAGGTSSGICIGGVIFEFLDEWWKDTFGNSENDHQTEAQFPLDFPDGFSHEEWYGIVSQGNGAHSPFQRELRDVYFYYKDLNK